MWVVAAWAAVNCVWLDDSMQALMQMMKSGAGEAGASRGDGVEMGEDH